MTTLKSMTVDQIVEAVLVGRPKARRIAVENFIGSLTGDRRADTANVYYDAGLYRWNADTVSAIKAGIGLWYRWGEGARP